MTRATFRRAFAREETVTFGGIDDFGSPLALDELFFSVLESDFFCLLPFGAGADGGLAFIRAVSRTICVLVAPTLLMQIPSELH